MKLKCETERYIIYEIKQPVGEGNLVTNVYLIQDRINNEVIIIDPAYDSKNIEEKVKSIDGKLVAILLTHSHADHIGALCDLMESFKGVKTYIHEEDYDGLLDDKLNEMKTVGIELKSLNGATSERVYKIKEGKIEISTFELYILHTPGHTRGGICIELCGTDILFTGDTAFENTYGRTDLSSGNKEKMRCSLDRIFDKYSEFTIFPGHGDSAYMPVAKRKINLVFAYKGW